MINQNLNCVWRSLGSQLSGEIRDVSSRHNKEDQGIEAVDLITFFLSELSVQDKPVTIENLKNLATMRLAKSNSLLIEEYKEKAYASLSQHAVFLEMIAPIFSNLLSGVEKISN